MADTYTSILQLLKQETGSHNNDWGNLLNTQVIDRIEAALAGVSTIAVTGGTKLLTDDEARSAILVISGALTSASIVEIPASRTRVYKVHNITTGNFPVSIRVTGTTNNFTLTRGNAQDLWCDSSSFYETGPGQVPVGSSVVHWNSTIPANFLNMNGQAVSRTQYPRLFAAIGTVWGTGDGSTTFNVPNATDRYIRHVSGTYGLGYLAQDVQSHAHTASSDAQGFHGHTGVTTTNGNHNHDVTNAFTGVVVAAGVQGGSGVNYTKSTFSTSTDGNHAHTLSIDGNGSHAHNITVNAAGGTETRPNSINGYNIIRYQ
jgi:microcystin-dependent protein